MSLARNDLIFIYVMKFKLLKRNPNDVKVKVEAKVYDSLCITCEV